MGRMPMSEMQCNGSEPALRGFDGLHFWVLSTQQAVSAKRRFASSQVKILAEPTIDKGDEWNG